MPSHLILERVSRWIYDRLTDARTHARHHQRGRRRGRGDRPAAIKSIYFWDLVESRIWMPWLPAYYPLTHDTMHGLLLAIFENKRKKQEETMQLSPTIFLRRA
jgi:hypothetical protein